MENYYRILGLNYSAGSEEIRRAYRILARRYHPDVNPGAADDRFRLISEAYQTLSDSQKRAKYDADLEALEKMDHKRAHRVYREKAREGFKAQSRYYQSHAEQPSGQSTPKGSGKGSAWSRQGEQAQGQSPGQAQAGEALGQSFRHFAKKFGSFIQSNTALKGGKATKNPREQRVTQISIIEVSLTLLDAIQGVRKSIELQDGETRKKISVQIPAGVRHGDIVRLRNKVAAQEEIVLLVRIAQHPSLTLKSKGLVVEIPISIEEAMLGASIQVPSLDDPIILKIPAGSQSGMELRVRDKGAPNRDGSRGDLFYRLLVHVPSVTQAPGLQEACKALGAYSGGKNVRQALPQSLQELARL